MSNQGKGKNEEKKKRLPRAGMERNYLGALRKNHEGRMENKSFSY